MHYLGELHHDAASFSEFLSQCYRCIDTRLVWLLRSDAFLLSKQTNIPAF